MENATLRVASICFRSHDGESANNKGHANEGCAPRSIHEVEREFYSWRITPVWSAVALHIGGNTKRVVQEA